MAVANLYQRNGNWYVRVQINGRDFRRSLITQSRETAEERLAIILREITNSAHPRNLQSLIDELKTASPFDTRFHYIYFIQGAHGDPIKIGRSRNPEHRLRELQTGSRDRLRLLGKLPAAIGTEAMLHSSFSRERLEGEWFKFSPRLRRFVGYLFVMMPAQESGTGDAVHDATC